MTAQVLNRERAAGCRWELQQLLDLWEIHGTHDITVAADGGYRFGPIDEAKQENFFRTGMSKARSLRETPHGRRCGLDCHPVGFDPHRDFASQPGMREKFLAWGAFIDRYGPPLGLRWGGHFGGFGSDGDMPHAELKDWSTRYQFPGGDPIVILVPPQEKQ